MAYCNMKCTMSNAVTVTFIGEVYKHGGVRTRVYAGNELKDLKKELNEYMLFLPANNCTTTSSIVLNISKERHVAVEAYKVPSKLYDMIVVDDKTGDILQYDQPTFSEFFNDELFALCSKGIIDAILRAGDAGEVHINLTEYKKTGPKPAELPKPAAPRYFYEDEPAAARYFEFPAAVEPHVATGFPAAARLSPVAARLPPAAATFGAAAAAGKASFDDRAEKIPAEFNADLWPHSFAFPMDPISYHESLKVGLIPVTSLSSLLQELKKRFGEIFFFEFSSNIPYDRLPVRQKLCNIIGKSHSIIHIIRIIRNFDEFTNEYGIQGLKLPPPLLHTPIVFQKTAAGETISLTFTANGSPMKTVLEFNSIYEALEHLSFLKSKGMKSIRAELSVRTPQRSGGKPTTRTTLRARNARKRTRSRSRKSHRRRTNSKRHKRLRSILKKHSRSKSAKRRHRVHF